MSASSLNDLPISEEKEQKEGGSVFPYSLFNLMCEREWMPLTLNEIRLVTHQLLVSVEAIHSVGIMHTDLKLDNIMLVNHKHEPFKIKLINFGHALPVCEVQYGNGEQTAYTAPEVTLGLTFSESVDMWGVGCILLYLYFGQNPLLYTCAYSWMKAIVNLMGFSKDQALWSGIHSWRYFIFNKKTGWRLRTPEEFQKVNGVKPQLEWSLGCTEWKLELQRFTDKQDELDRLVFLDLVKCCLHLDADLRISPSVALKHPFFTMVDMANILQTSCSIDAVTTQDCDKESSSIPSSIGASQHSTTIDCEFQVDMENMKFHQQELVKIETLIPQNNLAALKKRKPSIWKRMTHFLGLRKPQICKKEEDPAPN